MGTLPGYLRQQYKQLIDGEDSVPGTSHQWPDLHMWSPVLLYSSLERDDPPNLTLNFTVYIVEVSSFSCSAFALVHNLYLYESVCDLRIFKFWLLFIFVLSKHVWWFMLAEIQWILMSEFLNIFIFQSLVKVS